MRKLFVLALFCSLGLLQPVQAEEAHGDESAPPAQEAMEASVAGTPGKCRRCHDFGSEHILGPSLAGVFGRKAGASDYKRYSVSLKNASFFWTEKNLTTFLRDTKTAIRELTGDEHARTRMPPLKISDAEINEAIAFLKTLK